MNSTKEFSITIQGQLKNRQIFYSKAQPNPNEKNPEPEIDQLLELIYNFQFLSADSLNRRLSNQFSDKALLHLASANLNWWRMISGEKSITVRINFLNDLNKANDILKKIPAEKLSDEEIFILINTYSFKARLNLMEENVLKGLMHLSDCLPYIRKTLGNESRYQPLLLTSGLYNYFCDYGLKEYPILYPSLLIIPKGDMAVGRYQLEKISLSEKKWLSNEGHYFLLRIKLDLDKDADKALKHANILTERYPNNLIFQELLIKILKLKGEIISAEKQLVKLHQLATKNKQLTSAQKKYFLSIKIE